MISLHVSEEIFKDQIVRSPLRIRPTFHTNKNCMTIIIYRKLSDFCHTILPGLSIHLSPPSWILSSIETVFGVTDWAPSPTSRSLPVWTFKVLVLPVHVVPTNIMQVSLIFYYMFKVISISTTKVYHLTFFAELSSLDLMIKGI